MYKTKGYLLKEIATLFFPLFFTLSFVASVVLLIKISSLTSIISVSFFELFFLFFYSIPQVLFYVLPLSFFAASVITLARLIHDFELPVLFSLGYNPQKILNALLPISFFMTVILLLISLLLVPLSMSVYQSFLEEKKDSNALNIRPSQLGQSFGDWLVFIGSKDEENNQLQDVAMFSQSEFDEDSLVLSKEATLSSDDGSVKMSLNRGEIFIERGEFFDTILFDSMDIYNPVGMSENSYLGIFEHWMKGFMGDEKRLKEFAQALLISLFPLISLYYILAFGLINPKSRNYSVYAGTILFSAFYYGLTYYTSITYPLVGMVVFILLVPKIGQILFKRGAGRVF
ncbi:MAG: LptF/LptG family permease [Campylobacterales bacterium]